MINTNNKSPEKSINLTNNIKKEIAKSGYLAILPLTEKYKIRFKRLLSYYLRKYFSKPWKENKNDTIWEDIWDNLAWEILSEKLFKDQNLHQAIFSKIENYLKKNNLTLQNLESLEIINWELFVKIDNWEKVAFDLSAKSMEELVIQNTTDKNLKEYKEEMSTTLQIVMWWSIVTLTYGQFIETWNALDKKIDVYNMMHWDMKGQQFLQNAEIEIDWKKVKIDIKDRIFMLKEKHKISQVDLFEIIKKDWIKFNYETNQFEKTTERLANDSVKELEFKNLKESIKRYSYKEYLEIFKKSWLDEKEKFSEKNFNEAKRANIDLLKELNSEYNSGKNRKIKFWEFFNSKLMWWFFWKVSWKALHFIMFPIFFKEIQKHSWNLDSYLKWAVEFWAFVTWAKYWSKYMPWPFMFKMIAWLVVWWAAAVLGEDLLHSADKFLLSNMINREDFLKRKLWEDWKNIWDWAGWILWWELNDLADWMNENIWFDFNRLNPFKRKEALDINLWENDITFWTSIIDHMNERTGWKDQWNKEIDEFKIRATQRINSEVLNENFKYSDVFEDDNYFWLHSFTENLSKWLEYFYNPNARKWSVWLKYEKKAEKNAKKIFEFTEKNLDKTLLLWQFIDDKDVSKWKSFDKIKEELKTFLIENKILEKESDINGFIEYYEGIFYNKMDQKIDDILWNPNIIESLLQASWDIHNTTKEIKAYLKNSIKKWYYRNKVNKTEAFKIKNKETWEYDMSPIETLLVTEINKLKINDTFVEEYDKVIIDDKKLLDKALSWEVITEKWKPVFIEVWEYTFIKVSEEIKEEWKIIKPAEYFKTTWSIEDIIYISSLPEKDRKFTKEIFKNILNTNKWNLLRWKGTIYMNEKRKFKRLLENDNYHIFFNRMIDFKRRKYFIESINKYWDSKEVNKEILATKNFIKVLLKTDIINAISYLLND